MVWNFENTLKLIPKNDLKLKYYNNELNFKLPMIIKFGLNELSDGYSSLCLLFKNCLRMEKWC